MHALYVTPAWAVLYVSGVQCLVSVINFYWSEPWPRCTIYLKSILYNVDFIRGPESALKPTKCPFSGYKWPKNCFLVSNKHDTVE